MSLSATFKKLAQLSSAVAKDQDNIIVKLKRLEEGQEAIIRKVLLALRPYVITILLDNYRNSGLVTRTGGLLAALANPVIRITERGIRVEVSGHYQQAAAMNYGFVVGEGGRRLKANVKKTGAQVPGLKVVKARPFLIITDAQLAEVQTRFNQMYQLEVDRITKK